MLKIFILLYCLIVLSHQLALKNPVEDVKNYYEIPNIDATEETPIIIREIKKEDAKQFTYKIILPTEKNDEYDDDFKDYVIIKSKRRTIDVVPYTLIKRLDKIKYMILWLNLYCDMHPDCDKSVLNEELRKVVSAVEETQGNGSYLRETKRDVA